MRSFLIVYFKVTQTAMFDIFIAELAKNTTENQPNIYIDRFNKLMKNSSMLSRRESIHLLPPRPHSNSILNGDQRHPSPRPHSNSILNGDQKHPSPRPHSNSILNGDQRHPSPFIFATNMNKQLNKILKLPNILDSPNGTQDIIAFLNKELEVG